MYKLKAVVLILMLSFLSGINTYAEEEKYISDREVENYAEIIRSLKAINMHAQNQVLNIVMAEGMAPERFYEIYRAKQNNDTTLNLSDEELAVYNNIAAQFREIQIDTRNDAAELIKDAGLTMERYKEIGTLAQMDKNLHKRIQEVLKD